MVEQLRALLREQADGLVPPAPDSRKILREGRALRRRRPVGTGLATAAAVGGIIAGGLALLPDADVLRPKVGQAFAAQHPTAAYREYGAFSVGSTVFVGNMRVSFDAKVKSLYYTSEGVLVRMGREANLEPGGPSRYALIEPDGSTRGISLPITERVPGTDPDSPYVTYATPAEEGPLVERCFDGVGTLQDGGEPERQCHSAHEPRRYDLVAVDLRTGREAHRATYQGTFTWGGWEAPPVTTHGDAMWALFDDGWVEYDWAAGKTRLVPHTKGSAFEAAGGVYLVEKPASGATVHDFRTGEELLEIPPTTQPVFRLSPNGASVRVEGYAEYGDDDVLIEAPGPSRFVHVGSGKELPIPGDRLLGWTPEGDALAVDPEADRISVCDADTGRCHDVSVEIPEGPVKLGGKSYES